MYPSHGKDGVVYAADGQSINMEYIYEFFNNRNCPLLRGKPKFFIVQACRGDRPDQGVDTSEPSTAPPSPEKTLSQSKKRRAEGLDAIACTPDPSDIARARLVLYNLLQMKILIFDYQAYLGRHDHCLQHHPWLC